MRRTIKVRSSGEVDLLQNFLLALISISDSAQRSFTTIRKFFAFDILFFLRQIWFTASWLDTESYDDLLSGPKSLLMESCRHFVGQQLGKTNEDRNNALQRLLATRQKKSVATSRIPVRFDNVC